MRIKDRMKYKILQNTYGKNRLNKIVGNVKRNIDEIDDYLDKGHKKINSKNRKPL